MATMIHNAFFGHRPPRANFARSKGKLEQQLRGASFLFF
jgi:hypothetical protein